MRSVALLPSKATLYLTLGLLPFAADLLPKRLSLDITRPGVPYFAGALIIVLQLLAGAAGHILDVFFQKSRLDRKTIVATKAVTQVTGHVYRILYFGSFAAAFDDSIPVVGVCGGDRPVARRHLAGRARAHAHDGRWLPHVEPARHHRRQRHLPGALASGWWRCRENSLSSPACFDSRDGERESNALSGSSSGSASAARVERHEVLADVDVDVAHAGVGHGAAGLVVGDQPAHHLALAAAGIEVDRLAGGMLGDAPRCRRCGRLAGRSR